MSEKKKQIMEVALRCFSRSGFQAASIQEIAQELGMAKGSIYFYFKSKEELILSVIAYFGERMLSGMALAEEERGLPPRERLSLQLRRLYAFMQEHRDFPTMMMRQPTFNENERSKLEGYMAGLRSRFEQWLLQYIDEIYGAEAEAVRGDAQVLFGGMVFSYMRLLMMGRVAIDASRLAKFQTERLEDIVQGMKQSQVGPILPRGYAGEDEDVSADESSFEGKVRLAVRAVREAVEREPSPGGSGGEERRGDLLTALSRFEAEFAMPIPDRISLMGMLALMKETAFPAWQADVERLAELLYPQR